MKLIDSNEVHLRLSRVTHYGQIDAEDAFQAVEDCDDMQIHAHWITKRDMGCKYIKCSHCGAESGFDEDISKMIGKYCKCCGARMDEVTK